MSNMNLVVLCGRVGRKPEVKYTAAGLAILNVGVATNKSRKVNNEWTKETAWHDVVLFGEKAESVVQRLDPGTQVLVEGELDYREYQDKNGSKVKKTTIVAKTLRPIQEPQAYQRTVPAGKGHSEPVNLFTGGLGEDDIPF